MSLLFNRFLLVLLFVFCLSPVCSRASTETFEGGSIPSAWQTSGDDVWSVTTTRANDGVYAAEAPSSIADNQASILELHVDTGAGDISFAYSVSSEANFDFLKFYIDGAPQGEWSGEVSWTVTTYSVAAGSHVFKWEYVKDISASIGSDTAWIDSISYPDVLEDFESVNLATPPWQTNGDGVWSLSTVKSYDGISSAEAPTSIVDNQASDLQLSADTSVGDISFAYSVSSEAGYDFLRFYIDDVQQDEWSGEIGWSVATYPVTSGSHVFKWEYSKDGIVSAGSDTAWIDVVSYPGGSQQQAPWSVYSVYIGSGPVIDWPASEHGIVNVGEYLQIGSTAYLVTMVGNCTWSGPCDEYYYAELQQVNQVDGTPLWENPPTNTVPLFAEMAGTETMAITHYVTWPGSLVLTVNSVYPSDPSHIDWDVNIFGAMASGDYVLIDNVYYLVVLAFTDSWNGTGFRAAQLFNCDQLDGTNLGTYPDMTGTEGVSITHYVSWPGPQSSNIVNGSFETGDYSGWTLVDTSGVPDYGIFGVVTDGSVIDTSTSIYDWYDFDSFTPSSPGLPHTFYATNGTSVGINLQNGPASFRMYQDVALSADAQTLDWDMWWNNNFTHNPTDQFIAVNIRDSATDAILATVFKTTDGVDPLSLPGMTPFSVDISPYAGSTVRIDIQIEQYNAQFDLAYDNFRISSASPGPQIWNVYSVEPTMQAAIDWPVSEHGTVNQDEYLEVNGTIYYIYGSGNCSWTVSPDPCDYNWADLQQADPITGAPLDDPQNPGNPLWADLSGVSNGMPITHYATWPGPQGSWTVHSVFPGSASDIDWPVTEHGTVNPGEYLEVNGIIYAVTFAGNCSWSGPVCEDYNFAVLQQVNQITGTPLDDPLNPGNPFMADMAGTEGMAITHYAIWPGSPEPLTITPKVAAGSSHSIAVREDGSLWAWGVNANGQLGDGTNVDKNTPVQIGTATDWAEITAGLYHSIGL